MGHRTIDGIRKVNREKAWVTEEPYDATSEVVGGLFEV